MISSILLSAIPLLTWLIVMAFVCVVMLVYYALKFLWIKIHTLEGPIEKEIILEDGQTMHFLLFKEKYGNRTIYRIVSENGFNIAEFKIILEQLIEVGNNDVYSHKSYRIRSSRIVRLNNEVKYIAR